MPYIIENYADIKQLLNDECYRENKNIILKNHNHLSILKYNKNKLTPENNNTLGLFRSVVINELGEIVCFAPPKSMDFDIFSQTNKKEECIFEIFYEGTMINVFFDKIVNDWQIATRSNIGAKCNFNQDSNVTYRSMFLDAMLHTGLEFWELNKDWCYSFVLQHPKNRIVKPIVEPKLIITNIYNIVKEDGLQKVYMINDQELIDYYGSEKVGKICKFLTEKQEDNTTSWNELIEHYYSLNLDYKIQGVIIYNKKGDRTKIRNKNYEKIKHLKGNSPKLQYQYYTLRQNNKVKEFLEYYPEYKNEFFNFRKELHSYTSQLYQNYINCFIKKQKPLKEYPFQYKTHMFKLHEHYLLDLKPDNKYVNKSVVINYVNTLPPPRLMFVVNYVKKEYDKDYKVVNSDLKVVMKSEI